MTSNKYKLLKYDSKHLWNVGKFLQDSHLHNRRREKMTSHLESV
jgi:hypothetical protein